MTYSGAFLSLEAAIAAQDAAQAAIERQRELARKRDAWYSANAPAGCVLTTNGEGRVEWVPAPLPIVRPDKCPSCGSREWTPHAGKEVCAYCRSDRGCADERPIHRPRTPGFGDNPGPR